MTATYTNDPANRPVDRVRLEIDDKNVTTASDAMLTDEEIQFFIGDNSHILLASAAAADAVATKFASDPVSKTVGDLEIDYGTEGRASAYKVLAGVLRARGRRKAGSAVYAGGLTKSDKAVAESDSDRVQPVFALGMMNNPATDTTSREDFD